MSITFDALSSQRIASAVHAFHAHDFGSEVKVQGYGDLIADGDLYRVPVLVDRGDDDVQAEYTLHIRFAPGTSAVMESRSVDAQGVEVGIRSSRTETHMIMTVDLHLMRKPGAFASQEDALSWVHACLNNNTNHVEANVVLRPS